MPNSPDREKIKTEALRPIEEKRNVVNWLVIPRVVVRHKYLSKLRYMRDGVDGN